jgi:hypothetical protein
MILPSPVMKRLAETMWNWSEPAFARSFFEMLNPLMNGALIGVPRTRNARKFI